MMAIAGLIACGRAPSLQGGTDSAALAKYPLESELGVLLPSVYAGGDVGGHLGRTQLDEFERSTGCRLKLSTADDPREFEDKLQRAAIDVVVADGVVGVRLIQSGEVQPLDPRRLSALSGVDARFADLPWLSPSGVRYALPFQAGAHVLLYNPEVFPEPLTSWSLLYEAQALPDGRPNAGRMQSLTDASGIADAALYLRMRRPPLAIADPFELDERQYAAAVEAVRDQRPLLHGVAREEEAKQREDFKRGAIVAMSSTVRQFDRLRDEGANVAMSLPAEGSTGWLHVTMLKTAARHPNCAYAFMAWSLKSRVQAELSASASSLPVVAAVCRDGRLLEPARCAELGAQALDRVRFSHLPTMRCRDGSACVPYSRWLSDFESIAGDVH